MIKPVFLCVFFIFTSCSKNTSQKDVDQFNQEHNKYLLHIKSMSEKVIQEDFNFEGIEIIYVQSGKAYYQWLGHVFLRFVNSGKSPENDLGVSFIADFNEYNLDNMKAYYGGYTVLPVVDIWKNYIQEYLKDENRYMDRFIIPTTSEQRAKIKSTIKSWINDPNLPGTYSFRRNSCTALLLKLLASAMNNVDGSTIAFPIEVISYLKKVGAITNSYKRIIPGDKNFNSLNDIKEYQL